MVLKLYAIIQFWSNYATFLGTYFFFNMTYEVSGLTNILFGFGYDESKSLYFGGKWMESDAKVGPKACVNTFRHLLSVSTYIETW